MIAPISKITPDNTCKARYRTPAAYACSPPRHTKNTDEMAVNSQKRNKVKRRLRNIMNEAVKKLSINFNYSYLVIAKMTMLNNEYAIIKDTLFQDIEKIK